LRSLCQAKQLTLKHSLRQNPWIVVVHPRCFTMF
jgi:hypothetical protein